MQILGNSLKYVIVFLEDKKALVSDLNEIMYKCPKCGLEHDYNNFLRHHRRVHGGFPEGFENDMKFPCKKCSESFQTSAHLSQHIYRHHPIDNLPEILHCHLCNNGMNFKTPGMDFFIYGWNCCQIFFGDLPTWGGTLGPKLHPGGGFFGPWFLYKLYFEFTRSWSLSCSKIVIFLTNYQKLQILASYYNLRIGQDSEFAKFWPRALKM